MPSKPKINGRLSLIYQHQAIDLLLFAYVTAINNHVPSNPDIKSIKEFMKYFEILEDDIGLESLQIKYHRIKKEFLCGK